MMYRLLAVALAVASATAQTTGFVPFVPTIFQIGAEQPSEPLFAFQGNNTFGPGWAYPTWAVTSGVYTCTPGATNTTRYTPIVLNISVASVYQIAVQAEKRLRSSCSAFIVNKADPSASFEPTANPCNLPFATPRALVKAFSTQGGPSVNDFVYLPVGFYDLIITASDSNSGMFAANIWQSAAVGTTTPPTTPVFDTTTASVTTGSLTTAIGTTAVGTTAVGTTSGTTGQPQPQPSAGSHYWQTLDDTWPGTPSCDIYSSSNSYTTSFKGVTFNSAVNQLVDVVVAFDWQFNFSDSGPASSFIVSAALYQGSVNEARIASNPCDPAFNFLGAIRGSSGSFASTFYNVSFAANTTYTLIVSGGQGEQTGQFGVFARPTIVRSLITTPTYVQPVRDQAPVCTAASGSGSSWYSYVFSAAYGAYLIDTGFLDSGFNNFDSYSFLYKGVNNASATTGAPLTCLPAPGGLVVGGDTGDITPVFTTTTPGETYTVVVSTYNSGTGAGQFALYVFSGTTVTANGQVVPNTGPTSSSTSTSTTGGDVGAASSVAVNALLLIVGVLAVMLHPF